ncbi:MAG: HD family hydrolase [Pseudomonadota bacterium]
MTPPSSRSETAPPRAWQRMLSGRRLDLLDPSPLDIEIEDIAHGLARVARWNGQTSGPLPFNVAHHSLIVEELTCVLRQDWPAKWRLAALLHDAPEYVIGDMISPFKAALGTGYREVEARLQRAIHRRFGLPEEPPRHVERTIKRADQICAYYEAVQIAGFSPDEARTFFGDPRGIEPIVIDAMDAQTSKTVYLSRFEMVFSEDTL